MASDVDIANMALSIVGSNTTVSSMSPPDGSAAANYCATFYDIARREALAPFAWSFARTRAPLAELANPSDVWGYAYALPSDCLRVSRVAALALNSLNEEVAPAWNWLFNESGGADFAIETDSTQKLLLTHEPGAVLFYIRDQANPSTFTPGFVTALSYLLASYLAGPIIRGNAGVQTAQRLRLMAVGRPEDSGRGGMLGAAAATDAQGSESAQANFVSDAILARA